MENLIRFGDSYEQGIKKIRFNLAVQGTGIRLIGGTPYLILRPINL